MNHLNSVIVEGELADKAKVFRLPSGFLAASFCIETIRTFKDGVKTKTETNFIDIECYGKIAELVEPLDKGRGVRVVGHLKRTELKYNMFIVAEHLEIKPEKKKEE